MKNKYIFKTIKIAISDTSEAPRGKDLFYKCLICEDMISSIPSDDISCQCSNISIDLWMHKLAIANKNKFAIVQKKKVSS